MINALIRRMSVSARIVAAALTFCLFLLLLFPLVRASYRTANTQIQGLSSQELVASNLLLETTNLVANAELRAAQAALSAESAAGSASPRDSQAAAEIDAAIGRLRELQALYMQQNTNPPPALQETLDALAALRATLAALDASLAAGDLPAASQQAEEVRLSGDQIRGQLGQLLLERRRTLEGDLAATLSRWNNQFTALNAVIIGLFPLAVLIALLVARTISAPLNRISAALVAYAQGERQALATPHGNHEIGVLAQNVNRILAQANQAAEKQRQENEAHSAALANHTVQVQTAVEISQVVVEITDVHTLLDYVTTLVRDRFDLSFVGVYLLDQDGIFAILRSASGEAGQALLKRGQRVAVGDPDLIGQAAQFGETQLVNDLFANPAFRPPSELSTSRAEVVLPLRGSADHVIGVLDIHNAAPDAFSAEFYAMLKVIADQLALAIENARLSTALTQSQQEASTLLQRYTQESWRGLAGEQRTTGYRFDLLEVQPFQAVQADPLLARALTTDFPTIQAQVEPLPNGGSLLKAPLVMYNQVVGVIGLEEDDPRREWTTDEMRVLEALTTQISLALENARLLDEAQRRTTQIRLLQEVTSAASGQTDLGALLQEVTHTLRRDLDLDFVGAFLFREQLPGFNPQKLRFGAARADGTAGAVLHSLQWEAHSIPAVHTLLQSGQGELIQVEAGAQALGSLAFVLEQAGVTSLLLQPVLYRGQVIGLLDLHTSLAGSPFDLEARRLLDQVSLQLASAVEVALSFAQTTRRVERERQVTAIIQRIRETLDIPTILRTAAEEIRDGLVSSGQAADQPARSQTAVVVRLGATSPAEGAAEEVHL